MGNTFAAKGFSALSIRHVWWSKKPERQRIKLTSQIFSSTCLTPIFWPAKASLRLI
jgi:hypothetical protein